MERIAFRDRPYERNMDRDYIDRLRIAYDEFFSFYDEAPVLRIDTDELNFVRHPEDLNHVIALVESALEEGVAYTRPLFSLGKSKRRGTR